MENRIFIYLISVCLSLLSCNGNNQENSSASTDSLSTVKIPEPSDELIVDSLKAGPGTKSNTPADPATGISTSENGLSTDVGGIVLKDSIDSVRETRNP